MRRALLLPFSISFITLCVVLVIHYDAVKVLIRCQSLNIEDSCVVAEVKQMVDASPNEGSSLLQQIASLRRISLVEGDYRVYSLSLHKLGNTLYSQRYSFESIDENCPALMKDGCIHGYIMTYFQEYGVDPTKLLCETASDRRVKLACVHAAGHSYLESHDQPITTSLKEFCSQYGEIEYIACISGLFHEFSKGGVGAGHENYYGRSQELIKYSCDEYTGVTYTTCYGAMGSFRQYHPDSEDIKVTMKLCDEALTEEAKNLCIKLAYERLDIARGYSFILH